MEWERFCRLAQEHGETVNTMPMMVRDNGIRQIMSGETPSMDALLDVACWAFGVRRQWLKTPRSGVINREQTRRCSIAICWLAKRVAGYSAPCIAAAMRGKKWASHSYVFDHAEHASEAIDHGQHWIIRGRHLPVSGVLVAIGVMATEAGE